MILTEQPTNTAVPGTVFTPTEHDMGGEFAGVLVASLGEDGDAIALTHAKNRALEALDGYFREICGQPNLLDDATRPLSDAYFFLDSGYGVFTRRGNGGWLLTPAGEDTRGAVAVTWFRHPAGPVPSPYARHHASQEQLPTL